MAKKKAGPTWKTYEQIAASVLDQCAAEFGLSRFEGKQVVVGKSGTEWEVDARGWAEGNTVHFLVECKNYSKTAVTQAITGSLACTIQETDAAGGFLVSPRGLQSGAKKVAAAYNIHEIKLDPGSTTAAYFGEWLGKLRIGLSETVTFSERVLITKIDKNGNETVAYDSEKDNRANEG
ncbi:hypothetical protein WK07_20350 [Burkholderia multivorans]|uniref:restriction endonuclease n=1 Tax=Burkholderia multivorans TaxID=87883 RepID=UPI00075B388F|nr:restriction endonuclease [Burkholderia multivorans]KVQ75732.1 hypothetical protein WK07_20350 [Burkholderia multivorans]